MSTTAPKYTLFRCRSVSCLLLIILSQSCNKSNQTLQLTPNYDIYMAGTMDAKAVYWKNGVPVILSDSGSVYSIAVVGSDVYACGVINKGYIQYATYWKNRTEIPLYNQAWSIASGIAVQGGDVYISGCIVNTDTSTTTVYWKNGKVNYLSLESKGCANAIMVTGQNIYMAGYTYGTNVDSAIVWEDGKKVFLDELGQVNAISINGADTFFLGTLKTTPSYWKNNKTTELYYNGFADAVAFSGTDVYIGGGVRPNLNDNYAAIWKNDSITILTDQYTNSAVLGIAVANTDVYAVGYVDDEFIQFSPVYWKNGIMTKLGNNGMLNCIALGK